VAAHPTSARAQVLDWNAVDLRDAEGDVEIERSHQASLDAGEEAGIDTDLGGVLL